MLKKTIRNILVVLLLGMPLISHGETIKAPEVIGVWVDAKLNAARDKAISWLAKSPGENLLEINKDYSVKYTRTFNNGEKETIQVSNKNFEIHDDLIIINLPRKTGGKYKIVLSGWTTRTSKALFGEFYLYNKDGLFSGWQILLRPSSTVR